MQSRLIYRSLSTQDFVSNEALEALVEKSAKNNEAAAITGLLLYTGREYLQVLEGPEKAVNELFQKISRDSRHQEIRLVTFESIGPAYFEKWSMRLVDLYDIPGPVREGFMEKFDHDDGIVKIPDQLHQVFTLLLDAKAMIPEESWKSG